MPRGTPLDLTGQQFGRWTVLGRHGATPSKAVTWWCLCDCGTEAKVQSGNLRSGMSAQCRDCGYRQSAVKRRKEETA